jgi:hypothetical protein
LIGLILIKCHQVAALRRPRTEERHWRPDHAQRGLTHGCPLQNTSAKFKEWAAAGFACPRLRRSLYRHRGDSDQRGEVGTRDPRHDGESAASDEAGDLLLPCRRGRLLRCVDLGSGTFLRLYTLAVCHRALCLTCGLFRLLAFHNALVNWQIRTLRLGSWREFLNTNESWWPS